MDRLDGSFVIKYLLSSCACFRFDARGPLDLLSMRLRLRRIRCSALESEVCSVAEFVGTIGIGSDLTRGVTFLRELVVGMCLDEESL